MNRTLASFRPFTHLKSASEPIEIVKAKDSLLFDRNGKRYIDAIASWWVITHGHCHPHIVNAVKVAAERLDQIVFANFTHAPARALLDELSHMLPEEFVAAFFSDNGSTDVLKAARAKGILVIFDEVMTGFYRTGYRFAFEALNFVPDILCLSKGLTGGFLPLSLTLCHDKVFQQFWHDDKARTFFHGHTFTANPLSCAAAAANLQLMGDSVEKSVSSIEQLHRHRIENIKSSLIKE
ncbi:MAG: aminotransferase class III-fold pyridoxal phosphate-dependent enzyme, partial [Myxococcales bacterium]|nr:aminotransferase class III-fold pyridoxal phosphate-dependent enzyme [Myxococcales bacterium]